MNQGRCVRASVSVVLVLSLASFTACNSGDAQGTSGTPAPVNFVPNYSAAAPAHQADLPCGDKDPNNLCIALKYMAYEDGSGIPVVSNAQASANVSNINTLWSQCHIKFFLESYQSINSSSYGLEYQSSTMAELQRVRSSLAPTTQMLVVTTGQWTGDLGAQPANAWTELPPVGPFGAVLEGSVGQYYNIVAHELGHYLNLVHVADQYNVMNPVVYGNSMNIIDSQCSMARATAISFWGAMLR